MSRARRVFLSSLILMVATVFAYCVKEKVYFWPFSPHPMYSRIQGNGFGTSLAMGVSPAGEFRLTSKHLSPFTNSMIRVAVAKSRGRKKKESLALLRKIYQERQVRYPNDEEFPEHLLGVRIYGVSWRLKNGATNKDKPRKSLRSYSTFLPADMLQTLRAEAAGEPVKLSPKQVSKSDVVIDLGVAAQEQGFLGDPNAAAGVAVRFSEGSKKTPRANPEAFVDVEFEAPKGRYYVWLRGKSSYGKGQDSVWLQLDEQVGSKKVDSWQKRQGLGNWRDVYPANAFAWSSTQPGKPPGKLSIRKSGKHKLRISAREGPVVLDQLWLSTRQKELPLHSAPVRTPKGATK